MHKYFLIFYPVVIALTVGLFIFNSVVRLGALNKGNPVARTSTQENKVAKELKEKYNRIDPDDTIATYDPALVEINRFGDMSQISTTTMRLMYPPKKLQKEETMMFLNEGEQVILEPPASSLATVAVYDRSKHLLGYIPKLKNGTVLSLINQQRIIRGKITKLNKTMWNKFIEIEISYKTN
jgi:hypothetical protein